MIKSRKLNLYGAAVKNPNHPRKGSSIKVEPIRTKTAIERVKADLLHRNRHRDYCLFVMGINTAFRANELLSITVGQVTHLQAGDELELKQSKNGKHRRVTVNRAVADAIRLYLDKDQHMRWEGRQNPDAPLFYSQQKAITDVLSVSVVTNMLKKWCQGAGCNGNYGSHTMRKTWGYWQYKRGVNIAVLMVAFGHATPRQTLDYLCIQEEDVKQIYSMEL